jgi:hypothetical protein
MKTKITYLFLILPLLTFAQEFNSPGATDGFTIVGTTTNTLAGNGTDLVLTMNQGGNPIIATATAGINADANNYLEIRLKNNSTTDQLRFAPVNPATAPYQNITISKVDTSYKTYYVDITTWTGTVNVVTITGKPVSGSYQYVGSGETISIDYIRSIVTVPTTMKNTFDFDSTTEGFTILSRSTAVQATDSPRATLKINCTTASPNNAKVTLSSLLYHVEGANKYAHITLKNTSANTLFQLNGKVLGVGTAFNPIQTYTFSDTDYKIYDFDLSTWDSGSQFPELNFAVKNTWLATSTYVINDQVTSSNSTYKNLTGINTANSPRADIIANAAAVPTLPQNWELVGTEGALLDLTNFVYIDSIVFDNVIPSALGTADFGNTKNTISLYPNPAQEVLNISSSNCITNIEVYDLLGKKVASNNNASVVNVATLEKGAYIVKVVQDNGSVVAKQFIKK